MTLIRFYKPFGVLSQFRDPARAALGDYIDLPAVYPAGRLDRDSEGLMLLTDDGALQARIAHPRHKQPKIYWVQVEAQPTPGELHDLARHLSRGVILRDGRARAEALRTLAAPALPAREPPVTPHRAARSSWLEVTLTTGRNRQVRRMLAALGLPVLRLHRSRIGSIGLTGLEPGQWEEIEVPAAWARRSGHPEGGRHEGRHERESAGSPRQGSLSRTGRRRSTR